MPTILSNYLCEVPFDVTVKRGKIKRITIQPAGITTETVVSGFIQIGAL